MSFQPVKQSALLRTVPEPGQLVQVRGLQWLVADVDGGSLNPADANQHLIKLSSIGDDTLGDELEVIWELEPGASVIERAGLPELSGFDAPSTLQAFIDAVRWGAVTSADKGYLQAPFRSGISIQDFQLDPLVRAIGMARTNLLIADDVGLGKTIEAGLIIQEMLIRHRARTVIVLCPASLQEKWRREMQEKFGLDFVILNSEEVRLLRRSQGLHSNPWTNHPRIIASIDWAKQGEGLRLLKEVIPQKVSYPRKFDLLIVDEAHNVTPNVGRVASETMRTSIVRLAAPHFQHKLFLTATPHDGFKESWTALLELLDDQRFARNVEPDETQLKQVMIRRLKTELTDQNGEPLYPKRRLEPLLVSHTPEETELKELLEKYIQTLQLLSAKQGSRHANHFICELLRKRLSSSPAAFATTLEKHISTLQKGQQARKPKRALDERILRKRILRAQEDYADDTAFENAENEALEEATSSIDNFDASQREILNKLQALSRIAARQTSSKLEALKSWLNKTLKTEGVWNEQRVIIFTQSRATQSWAQEILASSGFGGERLAIIRGGMEQEEREKILNGFQEASPSQSPVRILLATDAASEGIDLQNYCSKMIHLEIPYNPNVLEQRNGRIDRHGQKANEVEILHPVDAVGEIGRDIMRAVQKLDAMRADMISVNPVLAPQFMEIVTGQRAELDEKTINAHATSVRAINRIDAEFRDRILKARERLDDTAQELGLSAQRIESAVRTALRLENLPDLIGTELQGVPSGLAMRLPQLPGTWARCLEGLAHPFTGDLRPITFDQKIADGRDDVVFVHLNHLLVQMSLRRLRKEVWALDTVKKIKRVSIKSLPDDMLSEPVAVVLSRLLISGGGHHRLHEEITESAGYLRQNGYRREDRIGTIQDWLKLSKDAQISAPKFDGLKEIFEKNEDNVFKSINARSQNRLVNLRSILERRLEKEQRDLRGILDDLEVTLQSEIEKDFMPEQLELSFSEEDRFQLRRDRQALEARLARIPEEREIELSNLANRYEDITAHTFPVAVVLLCPKSMTLEAGND